MKRRLQWCLGLLVLAIGLSSSAYAGQDFTDFGDDHLWSNPDNWSFGVVPDDAETHPSEVEPQWYTDIQMTVDGTLALIDDSVEAETFSLHVGAFGGDNTFEMTGGSLTVGDWALNVGRGGNRPSHEGSFGQMIMSGGTITTPFMVVPEQFVGSDEDHVQKGEVMMSGGTINARWLRIGGKIGDGRVELSGAATINLSSHLEMNPDGEGVASLDLSDDAVLNIEGTPNIERYEAFVDAGWLTANGNTTDPILTQTDDMLVISAGSVILGDFDGDGQCDAADIDLLSGVIRARESQSTFDLNGTGEVDEDDLRYMVQEIKNTWFGDANLDGEFNSGDFVEVFQSGEYEDAITGNSGWATGDWNGDGEFTSGDFVFAFRDGGYERGPRAVAAVPEPGWRILVSAILMILPLSRGRLKRP